MKLEDQVTSLELSKRLYELGVKQESLFSYYNYDGEHPTAIKLYSAFTVSELLANIKRAIERDRILSSEYLHLSEVTPNYLAEILVDLIVDDTVNKS